MTVPRYLAILEANNDEGATLLQKDIDDPQQDRPALNSIIMIWHVTSTHLRQIRDSAARLLGLMRLFDQEAISEHVLHGRCVGGLNSETEFEDDVAVLQSTA